jgi:hypothetical protein
MLHVKVNICAIVVRDGLSGMVRLLGCENCSFRARMVQN